MVSNRNMINLYLNVNHGYTTAQGVVKGMDGSFFFCTRRILLETWGCTLAFQNPPCFCCRL